MARSHSRPLSALGVSVGIHAALLALPLGGGRSAANASPSRPASLHAMVTVTRPPAATQEALPPNPATESMVSNAPAPADSPPPSITEQNAAAIRQSAAHTPMPIYFTAGELHIRPAPIGTVLQEEA